MVIQEHLSSNLRVTGPVDGKQVSLRTFSGVRATLNQNSVMTFLDAINSLVTRQITSAVHTSRVLMTE